MRRYGQDLMAMPGIAGVKWDRTLPGQVTVTFADDGFRALADNVLRDTVDGARLVLASITSGQPGAELPWWSNSFNQMQNAVRAMPGVVNSSQIMEHGLRDVLRPGLPDHRDVVHRPRGQRRRHARRLRG